MDRQERTTLREHQIHPISIFDIDERGVAATVAEVLSSFEWRPIHLALDIDAIDPLWAPSTGIAVSGGLSYREARLLCELLHQSGRLVGIDLAELNPLQGDVGEVASTADIASSLICSALGETLL